MAAARKKEMQLGIMMAANITGQDYILIQMQDSSHPMATPIHYTHLNPTTTIARATFPHRSSASSSPSFVDLASHMSELES